jgi:hypothetical protein
VAKSLAQASNVSDALASFRWERLKPLMEAEQDDDDRGRDAARILRELRTALAADEFTVRLPAALSAADQEAFEWLAAGQPTPGDKGDGPENPSGVQRVIRPKGGRTDDVINPLRTFLDEHRDKEVTVEWRETG